MKNIKNIAFAIVITIFTVSCKKEATPETKEVATTKTEIAAENLETASFTIEGMTCEVGCAKTIESKLTGTDGVSEATVDFETKVATVKFDKTKQSVESLTKTVEKVGGGDLYKVTKAEKSTDKV
jgi:Cu+-exporting ATPase